MYIEHTFGPFYKSDSRILILGTMPSPKSREEGFYYAHPQNRFWRIMAELFQEKTLENVQEKMAFLEKHKIALWDVLFSCEIQGADDSSIKNPKPNKINRILYEADIQAIFTTGKKAYDLYRKYCYPDTKREAISLPSTSPANCRMSYAELLEEYKIILQYL